jgi:hypothetical protein
MLIMGVSLLVAGVPLFGMLADTPVARTIAGILLKLSGVFVAGGGAALYLTLSPKLLLPSERTTISDAERRKPGGWLIALAIVMAVLPVWLVLRLLPFLAEWRQVLDFLATSGMWEGANSNGSGLVLLPLFAALTPPLFELAAMSGFVVTSVALLVLLLLRSRDFPRLYLVCVVLLSALVIASVLGANASTLAGGAVQQLMDGSSPGAEESALLREGLNRYTSIVSSTASVLVWALCGYLIWVPAMIFSKSVPAIFGIRAGGDPPAARAMDIEAITRPPRFPG